jgi:hypothetical protein
MRFMVLMIPGVYQGKNVDVDRKPNLKEVEEMGKFNDDLAKSGIEILSADGLHPQQKGTRISFVTGKPQVIDGPYIESKEVLGGFWMLKAKSKQEVVDWMKKCPAQKDDVLEIRQVFEMEDFEGGK